MKTLQGVEAPPPGQRALFFLAGTIPAAHREWAERQLEPLRFLRNAFVEMLVAASFITAVIELDDPLRSANWSWLLWWVPAGTLIQWLVHRPFQRRKLRKLWEIELNPPRDKGEFVRQDPPLRGREFPDRW